MNTDGAGPARPVRNGGCDRADGPRPPRTRDEPRTRGGAVARRIVWATALLLTAGCAALHPTASPGDAGPRPAGAAASEPVAGVRPAPAGDAAPAATANAAPTLGVPVEVDAPPELKALLERYLDIVRLGRIARGEVDESEWTRLIDAAPAQVRQLLQTEGYFEPSVELDRPPRPAAGGPELVRLVVHPGPRAHVTQVRLEVEGDLERAAEAGDAAAQAAREHWRAGWELPVGKEFRNAAWDDAKAAAQARLRAAGYATALWSGTAADVDVATGEVHLFVSIDSGPLFRFGSLQIDGLHEQDARTVANLVDARRGDAVTEKLLLDYHERLQKTGLFDSVSVTLDTDVATADAARIVVNLHEAPLQVYTLGVGVSANTGPRASVEHVYRRVFGQAATAHNKIEWGAKRQAWEGELSGLPSEGFYRNLLGGAVERLETSSDTVLSQRLRLGRTRDTTRIERLYFVESERSVRRTGQVETSAVGTSLNYHGVWRNLDSVILPTQGLIVSAQTGVGYSHGTNAVTGPFARLYARVTGYLPLGSAWFSQGRIELGRVFMRPGGVAPQSQLFRAGGDDSVRGYGYLSLGPIVDGAVGGGDMLFTSSVELARPVSASLPSVWGAVFVDAGNAANSWSDLKPVLGYGVGVRWRSPVGPLRLDLAYGQAVHSLRLHFSVGIAF
ncbi:MAG: BamA/TamA family outer membrane protein [Proteobacteria bacterium]|nr:BamA/TamA family outer membrane protein [Pseudomonadota bacterium]